MRNVFSVAVVVVCAATASGCVTNRDGVRTVSDTVQANAGHRTRVDVSFARTAECSFRKFPTVRVLEPPKHGSFETVHEMVLPSLSANPATKVGKCRDVPLMGVAGYYRPAPGFSGTDRIVTSHSFAEGRLVVHDVITIDVIK